LIQVKAGAAESANISSMARPIPLRAEMPEQASLPPASSPALAFERTAGPDEPPPTVTLSLDRLLHALMARATAGVSPAAVALAFADWWTNLALSPGKQAELVEKAARKWTRLALYAGRAAREPECPACIEPLAQDRRFRAPEWQSPPFNLIYQGFLLTQQWWHNATTGVRGVTVAHERAVNFITRQLLDMWSPSNFLWTNPEVQRATVAEGGQNFVRGAVNFAADWERAIAGRRPVGSEAFAVGRTVATAQGQVVLRTRLMELIQYAPRTERVQAEPVLILPAWIMKYYILDLSPQNSLVQFLTERGFTVFVASWKNPDASDRDLGMEDYLRLGLQAALDAIGKIVPGRRVHAVGYCLGGTLLAIGAAVLGGRGRDLLQSMSLLAAQVDFREAGELALFITEGELAYLEDIIWDQGFLDAKQMAGAFQLLRSADLVWSAGVRQYLLGQRPPMTDLMAWNADTTRMPYRMHSEYLRRLYLNNDLAEGRYAVDGTPVALSDIRVPVFALGTETDHVAPWRSVFKINLLTDTEVTFALTKGGHNAGVVGEPGHPGRHYRIATRSHEAKYMAPESWVTANEPRPGSWWPAFADWLAAHSTGQTAPPGLGAPAAGLPPLGAAPGSYVLTP
jgi:polyhydroxyalkanoate synthase subunit PhaC